MKRTPPVEAQPVVQVIRLRYRKFDRMRFASHRDFQRGLERAVRRAGIPVAISGGFSPHPRISYANAAPTGAASEAEYFEIGLARAVDPRAVPQALNDALPEGFRIVEAVVPRGVAKLADRLRASEWQLEFPGVPGERLSCAVGEVAAQAPVVVTRMTKAGRRDVDVTAAWVRGAVTQRFTTSGSQCAILLVVVRHVTPSVRPDDVLTALTERADLMPPGPVIMTRLSQGPLDESSGLVGDPLAQDRMGVVGALD